MPKINFRNRFFSFVLVLILFGLYVVQTSVVAQEDSGTEDEKGILQKMEGELQNLAETGRKHTVSITARKQITTPKTNQIRKFSTSFSGVVIRKGGYVVTVADPLKRASQIIVRSEKSVYRAEIVGTDRHTNLAVVRVKDQELAPVEFSERDSLRTGSVVVTMGNAFGFEGTVGQGIISGLGRTVMQDGTSYSNLIQMTAPVNPGDQGGLVMNTNGKLIGVITGTYQRRSGPGPFSDLMKKIVRIGTPEDDEADENQEDGGDKEGKSEKLKKLSRILEQMKNRSRRRQGNRPSGGGQVTPEGIHFALPVDTVKFVTDELIEDGSVDRGWIGVSVKNLFFSERRKLGLDKGVGLRIQDTKKGGTARKSGLKPGDVLVRFNDKPINSIGTLQKMVFRSEPGRRVMVEIIRDGERKELELEIGSSPGMSGDQEQAEDRSESGSDKEQSGQSDSEDSSSNE